MKKIMILMCAMGMLGSSVSYANEVCKASFGTMKCGLGTVSDISYTGMVEANGTTVSKAADVLGDFSAINSHLNVVRIKGESILTKTDVMGAFQMTGDLYANHATLSGPANIVGSMSCDFCLFKMDTNIVGDVTAEHTEFDSALTLSVKKATFSDSKLADIFIKKPSEDEVQTIYLNKGSRARNVTFENQRGVVILSGDSQVTGYVQGGKIVKNKL